MCFDCCKSWRESPFSQLLFACQLQSFASGGFIQFGLLGATFTQIQDDFDLSKTQLTYATTLYQVSIIIVGLLSPFIQDKFHTVPLEILSGIGCLIVMIGCIVYASAYQFWMLLVGQFLMGGGAALVFVFYIPMFAALITDDVVHKLADAIGKTTMIAPLGAVLAFLLVGGIGISYWRWFYGAGAVLMIPCTIYFLKLGIGYKVKDKDPRIQTHTPPPIALVLKSICTDVKIIIAVTAITGATFVVSAFAPFIAGYIHEHLGQSEETAALFLAATIPVIAIATALGGYIAHRGEWKPSRIFLACLIVGTVALGILCVVFGANVRNFWVFAVLVIILMALLFAVSAPALGTVAMLLPYSLIPSGQSVLGMFARSFGSIAAPFLVSGLIDPKEEGGQGMQQNIVFLIVGAGGIFVAIVFFGLGAFLCKRAEEAKEKASTRNQTSTTLAPDTATHEPINSGRSSPTRREDVGIDSEHHHQVAEHSFEEELEEKKRSEENDPDSWKWEDEGHTSHPTPTIVGTAEPIGAAPVVVEATERTPTSPTATNSTSTTLEEVKP